MSRDAGVNVTGDTPAEQTDELGNKYWIHTVTVRYATRKADLDAAPLRDAVLRYPEKPVEENGWIWIRTSLPLPANAREPLLWEIVIDDGASREAAK